MIMNTVDLLSISQTQKEQCNHEVTTLPFSIYNIDLKSADEKINSVLRARQNKVTMLFNVSAGCGNVPQHSVIEELNQAYKDEPDFDIIAITVDDFVCHGYPEFQKGLQHYIDVNNLSITPGQLAQKYAEDNYRTTYQFTELTNGRFDKHSYDSNFVPGQEKQQEQHDLWWYLTGAYKADLQPNGVPYHNEDIPWSYSDKLDERGNLKIEPTVNYFNPLRGNFEKFLIDRTGTKVKRYANGFLLGERNISGEIFPWGEEQYFENGRPNFDGAIRNKSFFVDPDEGSGWPTKKQREGIEISLCLIKEDIDNFLNS